MELKHIFRDDVLDGVWINARDFDPSIHREWEESVSEPEQFIEIAGLQEAIAPEHPKKTAKKTHS
jgi:hypothetical protein